MWRSCKRTARCSAFRELEGRRQAVPARARGGLTSGMSDADAAAAIWSLGHPQGYRTLVSDAGWSVPAYRDWLRRSLSAMLA